MLRPLSNIVLAAALVAFESSADARSVRDEPYSIDTTWNAAVRMVRVDLGLSITERDRELGYFTFDYREGTRSVPGSLEIVRTEVEGRPLSRVIVQIPLMPNYVEAMLLTRLARKLRSEYGEPPPPPRRPTPPERPAERPSDRPAGSDPPSDPANPRPPATEGTPSPPSTNPPVSSGDTNNRERR